MKCLERRRAGKYTLPCFPLSFLFPILVAISLCDARYAGGVVDYRSNFHLTVNERIASAKKALRLWARRNRPSLLSQLSEYDNLASESESESSDSDSTSSDDDESGAGAGPRVATATATGRVNVVGAMIFGVELGVAKLVKTFSLDERASNQKWLGSFVGKVMWWDAPFFGIFYDDGE